MKNNSQLIHKYRAIILTVVDAVIVFVAYFAAYFFRMDFGASLNTDYSAMIFRCMPIVLLLNLVFLLLFHVNKTLWQYVSIDEIVRIAEAICLANGIWFLVVCLLPVKNYPRSIPVTATMIQLIMMLALRVFYRMYRRHGLQANSTHRALIIGAGSAGGMAIKELSINERYDSKVVGLLDDNPDKKGQILSGCVVLGTTDDLKEVAAKNNVDLIYIAITNISKQNLKVIIDKCRDADLKCKIISSVST
ncbi:MAG: polysaccharide biosynthesis protein, partial [Erysipelotrichia bacterium]|nr:polysaccharide biosynthesis protein [Erysipelotrichia bacterium]